MVSQARYLDIMNEENEMSLYIIDRRSYNYLHHIQFIYNFPNFF